MVDISSIDNVYRNDVAREDMERYSETDWTKKYNRESMNTISKRRIFQDREQARSADFATLGIAFRRRCDFWWGTLSMYADTGH